MAEWSESDLLAECDRFCHYLVDLPATQEVAKAYRVGHRSLPPSKDVAFDTFLLRFARGGRWPLRLADTYARLVRPESLLRRKMTLAIAVLESSRATHGLMNAGPRSGRMVDGKRRGSLALLTLGPILASVVWWTFLSFLVLTPTHLWFSGPWIRRG